MKAPDEEQWKKQIEW